MIWRLFKFWKPSLFTLFLPIYVLCESFCRENGFMPTIVWLKIHTLKIKIFLNNSIKQLNSSRFSNIACFFYSGRFSWDVLGLYFGEKPSPISSTEPEFTLLSLPIPGFHARLQGWQGNILEIKCNRGRWHFNFASSAAKIINCTVFCYDGRSCKFRLTGLYNRAAWKTPHYCHHRAGFWNRFFTH